MIAEVELDLEISAAVRDRPRRQSARADVQRHMPPVIQTRMHRETYLANYLAVEMKRVLCRPPRVEGHFGERIWHNLGSK